MRKAMRGYLMEFLSIRIEILTKNVSSEVMKVIRFKTAKGFLAFSYIHWMSLVFNNKLNANIYAGRVNVQNQ